VTEESQNYE